MKQFFSILALVGTVLTLAACSAPPYIHKSGEFDRNSKDFGRPVTEIDSVTICYSSYSATPQQITKMAVDECALFNKTAEFKEQNYKTCPFVAPTAAIYDCLGDEDTDMREGNVGAGQGIPGGTLMNYDGIPFRY